MKTGGGGGGAGSFFKRRTARRAKSLGKDHWDDVIFGELDTFGLTRRAQFVVFSLADNSSRNFIVINTFFFQAVQRS